MVTDVLEGLSAKCVLIARAIYREVGLGWTTPFLKQLSFATQPDCLLLDPPRLSSWTVTRQILADLTKMLLSYWWN